MSLTIPYNSQAGIQVAGGGRSGPQVSASAFVTPGQQAMPGAVDKLLGGANKLVGVLHAEAIRKRKEQMELSLLEDLQGFQGEAQAWADTYQQQNQGKEGINAEADAQAFYKEKVDALKQRWEGNDFAQLYIQRHAGGMAVAGVNAMRDYGNAQQEAWKDSVFATETARASDVLSDWRRTPEEKQAEWSAYAGKQEAYYQSKGLDPTAARIKTDRIYRDAVAAGLEQGFTAKLNNGDIAGAERDYDVMAGKLPEISDDNMQSVVAAYADHPNARAFLNFIARSEGTAGRGDDGYNISYGGSTFDGYDKHPNVRRDFTQTDGKKNTTTAAGRYQFITPTWEEAKGAMGLSDMSPRSQDLAALYLIAKRGALKDVIEGNAEAAIEKLGKEWASLPSSPYAQPKHSGQNAAAMLEAAGFTRGGMVSPEKLRGYEKMLRDVRQEKLKTDAIELYSDMQPEQASMAALQDPDLARDPKAQKAVVEHFDWQAKQLAAEKKREAAAKKETDYKAIMQFSQNGNRDMINRVIDTAPPDQRDAYRAFAQRELNGDNMVSDPDAYDDALTRAANGDQFSVLGEYGDKLNRREVREIQKTQTSTYLAREKEFFAEEAELWLSTPEGQQYKKDHGATVNKLFMKFKATIPEDGYKDITARQKAFTAFWRKEVLEKPGLLFGTNSVESVGFRAGAYAEKGYLPTRGSEIHETMLQAAKAEILKREGVDREPTRAEMENIFRMGYRLQSAHGHSWDLPEPDRPPLESDAVAEGEEAYIPQGWR